MIIKLLAEHHLEFLSLKGGCRGSSESTVVKNVKIYLYPLILCFPICVIKVAYLFILGFYGH